MHINYLQFYMHDMLFLYMHYIQGFHQSRLGMADQAFLIVAQATKAGQREPVSYMLPLS
jgi:hypothetical protein